MASAGATSNIVSHVSVLFAWALPTTIPISARSLVTRSWFNNFGAPQHYSIMQYWEEAPTPWGKHRGQLIACCCKMGPCSMVPSKTFLCLWWPMSLLTKQAQVQRIRCILLMSQSESDVAAGKGRIGRNAEMYHSLQQLNEIVSPVAAVYRTCLVFALNCNWRWEMDGYFFQLRATAAQVRTGLSWDGRWMGKLNIGVRKESRKLKAFYSLCSEITRHKPSLYWMQAKMGLRFNF